MVLFSFAKQKVYIYQTEKIMVIGDKIKRLRLQCNLTQEELANRCELTKGYISQLENDLTSPSIATLIDILSALGTSLNEFFSEEQEEKIVFKENDFIEKITEKSTLNWLVPNAQKKRYGAYAYRTCAVCRYRRRRSTRR